MVPLLIVDTASPPTDHAQRTGAFSNRAEVVQTCVAPDGGAWCNGTLSQRPVIRKAPDGRVAIEV